MMEDGHMDYFGRPLKKGDWVMRRRKGEEGDYFRCHPGSFGQVRGDVVETWETRPDLGNAYAEVGEFWTEIQVKPYSPGMLPEGEYLIQWMDAECIKINRFVVMLLHMLWPLTALLYRRPLEGQSTDW